ncbi:hypothetical protein D779_2988 [Imhoffiella purpurea]|uniref:Uncharacterized protein n=1 Tax=Imhoffiella purpurea TaxID=1249627 RepID=W9V3L0_9GAMM|nr:hypothetical protein D779_2988 [Imhoffiella purpurea]
MRITQRACGPVSMMVGIRQTGAIAAILTLFDDQPARDSG